jgi:hypothetical protein
LFLLFQILIIALVLKMSTRFSIMSSIIEPLTHLIFNHYGHTAN